MRYVGITARPPHQKNGLPPMLPYQRTLIATTYAETSPESDGSMLSSFEAWKSEILALRGHLDRKKKIKAKDIAATIGCEESDADVFRLVFSVERYLEHRAIRALKFSGNDIDRPPFVVQAGARALQVAELYETHASQALAEEESSVANLVASFGSSPFSDVFQAEFQSLMPRQVRHALGQFYTPAWLARHIVRSTGYVWENPSSLDRVLCDPTCGSGAFLMAAAEEIRQAILSGGLEPAHGQRLIATALQGVDIEALPALMAHTGLALASHAVAQHYAIASPLRVASIEHEDSLELRGVKPTVDLLVGNPPWTNWEYMPHEFRTKHMHLWPELGIFDSRSSIANSKEDISALFVAHSVAHRLKDGGEFGFVLPESLLKSAKNHASFRRFRVGLMPEPYQIRLAEDFVAVKPFEGVANRTIALYGLKGAETTYPVTFHKWSTIDRKSQPLTGSEPLTGLREVLEAKLSDKSDETSSWSTSSQNSTIMHRAIDGKNAYRGRTGLFTGGANAVFHLEILGQVAENIHVRNITERAKRQVPQVTATLESTYIFPFLRGRDVQQWRYESCVHVLLPHSEETRMQPVPESDLRSEAPATFEYLSQFKDVLADRRGFSKWERAFLETGFYACQRVGTYTFAHWKVVWRYIAPKFITAVIGPEPTSAGGAKPLIPNEKLMIIACSSEQEAYYVGGVLASAPVVSHVQSRMVSTQIPPSIVQNIKVPALDFSNPLHATIARLCREGHHHAKQKNNIEIAHIEDALDAAVAELWSLDPVAVSLERSLLRDK